jgi:hypothetical protein
MSSHEHFEELAALSAGGLLSTQEMAELREHAKNCTECSNAETEFGAILYRGMPLASSPFRELRDRARTNTDKDIRSRFLARARRDGVSFATAAEEPRARRNWFEFAPFAAGVVIAAVVLIACYALIRFRNGSGGALDASKQQIEQLQQGKTDLNAKISQLNQLLSAQETEVERLRNQLEGARSAQHQDARSAGSTAQDVDLAKELESAQQQLADSKGEADRISLLHADDLASLAVQQAKIAELNDRLRVASATLDMERQIVESGENLRELLLAKQLHVIDVRDTDPSGKPGKAFGRVFVTEGKSITFYAFDLNEAHPGSANSRFEVWGSQDANAASSKKLGYLLADEKGDRRWVMKVNSPGAVKGIESVFVTAEPTTTAQTPTGPPMLFAYLGSPHRP